MGLTIPLILNSLKRASISILPSFIQPLLDSSRPSPIKRVSPTSYLDGLRGLAALFVFVYHVDGKYLATLMPTYGLPLSPDKIPYPSSPIQLPGLRILFSGRPMVHIFFIISGYALSLKSLKQIRAKETSALLATVSSALFRRAIRLFLPLIASTFIGALLLQMNFRAGRSPTFVAQMWDWWGELKQILDFWTPDQRARIRLDPHLWTIPIEMANSVVLFAVLIALARCRVVVRMGLLAGAVLVTMRAGQWVASEFLVGMWLAELGLIQEEWKSYLSWSENVQLDVEGEEETLLREQGVEEKEEVLEPTHSQGYLTRRRQLKQVMRIGSITLKSVCILSLVPAIWLAGWPETYDPNDSGFSWIIAHTTPPYNNSFERMQFPWFGLVAFQVIFACQQVQFLQSFFATPVVRYLGKISYALYLMHWSVLECLAPRVFPPVLRLVGSFSGGAIGPWGITLVWLLTTLAIAPVVIWAGDLFCTFVDDNCVAFAKWLEGKCVREDV